MKFCTSCGVKNAQSASFCGSCGNNLQEKNVNTCAECGVERKEGRSFCHNCFHRLEDINKEVAATSEGVISSKPTEASVSNFKGSNTNKVSFDQTPAIARQSGESTLLNIVANIVFSFFIFVMYDYVKRYTDIGGSSSSSVMFFLILFAIGYIVIVSIHRKRNSYSLLLPTVASAIVIIPTWSEYHDFKEWNSYQSWAMQSAVGDDTIQLLFLYLAMFVTIFLVNMIFLSLGISAKNKS